MGPKQRGGSFAAKPSTGMWKTLQRLLFGAIMIRWARKKRWELAIVSAIAVALHNHSIESTRKTYRNALHTVQVLIFVVRKSIIIAMRRVLGTSEHPYWTMLEEIVVKSIGFAARIGHVTASRSMIDCHAAIQRAVSPWIGARVQNVDLGLGHGENDALWITRGKNAKLGCCPIVLYYHGGGYATGNAGMYLSAHVELVRLLEDKHNITCGVLSIEYPLAPETKFPANLKFATCAYDAVVDKLDICPTSIVVGGDSAGGGVALAVAEHSFLRSIREDIAGVSGLILVSPWMNHSCESGSHAMHINTDFIAGPEILRDFSVAYAGEEDVALTHPQISPIHADVDFMPPVLLTIGSREVFRDDIEVFKDKLQEAKKEVEVHTGQNSPHIYPLLWPLFGKESQGALAHMADFCARRMTLFSR
mmetsp:Transcript_12585/g.24409  ORF Transcript_12585/g.24409 Transcript_12585/m.24409 type:complete len:419 (+) Transcript_12585:156-1412(+)|eukprot:CAMPEP_0171519202 /NCGR_PEP_ID=MMETSP0959-20130129/5749_1 /TAXON_ID=87120 /ORGANISM="Aurantiochytrium limacinum, Strain ATCCMYA-1381" /LENGTH=418 /DNA_ID=CAMNT_0012058573 /DNA_START=40 /DNA_END=1296 /DNA_ORIENTATION=+